MTQKSKENHGKNHGKSTALRPQVHGGALRNGGTNRGGTGRPPNSLRIASRKVFELWLEWAREKVSNPKTSAAVMMQIGNTAAKYGLGTTFTPTGQDGAPLKFVPTIGVIGQSDGDRA